MQPYDYANRDGVRDITWNEFLTMSRTLAEHLAKRQIDTIVGVALAGLLPATVVACALRADLYPVRITRRLHDEVAYERPTWKVDVSPEVAGRRVAVVDEMADTGETLRLVRDRVVELGAAEVLTVTLVQHTWADPAPDYAALISDALVMFPWDQQVLVDGSWQLHPELARAGRFGRIGKCILHHRDTAKRLTATTP